MMFLYLVLLLQFFQFLTLSNALNQLSLSGGGSFGAVEIGILKRILETGNGQYYDLYTGISAGALNAGFLSYFSDLKTGVKSAEKMYSGIRNLLVYELEPFTGLSLLNTEPLFKTLTKVIGGMPGEPVVHTLIGATNLYSGNLDVYTFEDNDDYNKVQLLMSSSAIPGIFPPINYNGQLYADGGTLSNELLLVKSVTGTEYLNITYITPYEGYNYNDAPITSLKDMIKRTWDIVSSNFNNPLATLNQNCDNPVGEINKYFVNPKYLADYNSLNFDNGKELVDIGYKYATNMKYKIC
jgi:predicted patatin/cPLA2 family phospholipase